MYRFFNYLSIPIDFPPHKPSTSNYTKRNQPTFPKLESCAHGAAVELLLKPGSARTLLARLMSFDRRKAPNTSKSQGSGLALLKSRGARSNQRLRAYTSALGATLIFRNRNPLQKGPTL